jgi:hypothetical protein
MMTETIAFLLALAVALGILLALVVSARRRRAFESGKISLLALALLAMQPACTARQAKIGALEFAACEGQEVVLPTLSSLGQALATRPDWQTWGLSTLGGALGPSVNSSAPILACRAVHAGCMASSASASSEILPDSKARRRRALTTSASKMPRATARASRKAMVSVIILAPR